MLKKTINKPSRGMVLDIPPSPEYGDTRLTVLPIEPAFISSHSIHSLWASTDLNHMLPHSPECFYRSILATTLAAIKFNNFRDNFDFGRFGTDQPELSQDFNISERVRNFDWFMNDISNLWNAYSALNDAQSKFLYLYLIVFRLAGHLCVKLPVDFLAPDSMEAYSAAQRSAPSRIKLSGMFGKVRHYDFEWESRRYVIDCLGLAHYLQRKQYFFERDGVSIKPEEGDYVIDGGAGLGDSAAVFSNAVSDAGRVFAFDPVKQHIEVLKMNVEQFPIRNVVVMPFGLGNEDIEAEPISLTSYSLGFSCRGAPAPLKKVDSFVEEYGIGKLDFMKLDVEGYEMEVLLGAQRSISTFKPKLAVSLYHNDNDIFELPTYIKRTYPFYQLFIGHYSIHREETVLYCKPAIT